MNAENLNEELDRIAEEIADETMRLMITFSMAFQLGFDAYEQSPIFKQMLKIITNLAECEGAVTEDVEDAKKLLKEMGK